MKKLYYSCPQSGEEWGQEGTGSIIPPLKFIVRPLYKSVDYDAGENIIQTLGDIVAYQLTPYGNYAFHTDTQQICQSEIYFNHDFGNTFLYDSQKGKYKLFLSAWRPQEPFLVRATNWETFKNIIHEYNMKYCDMPDIKPVYDFVEWFKKKELANPYGSYNFAQKVPRMAEEYKQTLCNKEQWFEEIK